MLVIIVTIINNILFSFFSQLDKLLDLSPTLTI